MSSVETGQMSAVETGQMSAAETVQMSAVEKMTDVEVSDQGSGQKNIKIPKGVQNGRQTWRIGQNESCGRPGAFGMRPQAWNSHNKRSAGPDGFDCPFLLFDSSVA